MAASTANAFVQPNGNLLPEVREYPKKIVIRSQNRIFLQTVSEIDHLTAAANYVQIHTNGQMFRIRSTINAIEQRLDPKKFGRVHRCAIVNFDCVKEFRPLQRGDYLLVLFRRAMSRVVLHTVRAKVPVEGTPAAVQRDIRDSLYLTRSTVITVERLLHPTKFGRAPLSAGAIEHLSDIAANYSNLEFDL